MQLPKIKGSKKERKQYSEEGFLESLTGIASASLDSLKSDLINEGSHEAWNEILLPDDKNENRQKSHAGQGEHTMAPGHEINLSEIGEKAHEITHQGREFAQEIIHAGERASAQDSQEIQVRLHEIIIEIKRLSESSGELQQQIEVITMEQTGEDVGVYHLNFLDQMLSYIHGLRLNVEDSLAWFGALRSKKSARQYSSMAKKHGTSFTLNNERQVATQVG